MVRVYSSINITPSELMPQVSLALAELGLEALDPQCEQEVELGFECAVRKWRDPNWHVGLEREDVRRLETVTSCLNVAQHHLATLSCRHEVYSRLQKKLAQERSIGNSVAAYFYFQDFNEKVRTVSRAVRDIGNTLRQTAFKKGQRSYAWYDDFVAGVILICESNGIKATISTNRVNSNPGGRFLEIAERLERILPFGMRSPNRQALAQRLKRSRRRIKEQSVSRNKVGDSFLC
jgi:hypothetical protein